MRPPDAAPGVIRHRCCGDGPLITDTKPGTDDLPASALAWPERHGWAVTPDPLCPNHS
ncbi:hypothetical protein [Rhodococcus sp. JS3073]|uniref:hypothetical protein n=1 Tax=Rhodococcus sp. JS3073 TaxID=3002901 RepID=UPI00228604D0|nr:hypothetical protein [Rhodococcus sp. JS3073]WAM14908.1 hypothetical protein OYT95_37015 [Rhodococcus sp. JS3073]